MERKDSGVQVETDKEENKNISTKNITENNNRNSSDVYTFGCQALRERDQELKGSRH